jgi:DNA-binding Xre family transcriptional regulator
MGFWRGDERAGFYEPLALNTIIIPQNTKNVVSGARIASLDTLGIVRFVAKQVRLTLAKAIARANLLRADAGIKPITMNALAVQAGVSATTITRLARDPGDSKSASALSLDLASKIVTVLDCGIEDLLEVTEGTG